MGVQTVVFAVGQEEYGLPIEAVHEIARLGEVRPVPDAPPFVRGLINLRGLALPVVDLRVRFGLPAPESDDPGREVGNALVLVAEIAGDRVGLAVDEVVEVTVLEDISPPPSLVSIPFISGLANLPDRIIMQLDPEKILAPDELRELLS
ncbi:CheW-like domain protein [Acididesulfobacillus acetoxydans]|uniref:CheW-like domain protein n=1 Tax=Acididesulfobacillus acetoxydans TaxID=1561005 RepID=A0A8S0X154_9FIRM|nr:chemotaxis protein CheW [Acididesulfobacillus acetoxydans]CAA7602941.1 CheW-like domain protein [Acididesulfobacillus acetoxydans]CEJ05823.1 Chemotaxis signal transduction protein [Acididesulfobacillus acetoxydans]